MRIMNVFFCAFLFSLNACASLPHDQRDFTKFERATIASQRVIDAYKDLGPGAAYIIRWKGDTLASGGVGYANLEWGTLIDDKTLFRLGSISKPLTAIAVLQLVQKGVLSLDEPASKYAPGLPSQIGAVTLRQLLSHRSGLAEHVWNPEILPFIWQPMTTDQIIELQKDFPPEFAPGEKYNYVNFNYVVAAHIIEQVTGQPFIDFANNEIFAANGMSHSAYDQLEVIIKNRAEFYEFKNDTTKNTLAVDLSHVSAAGALLSSAHDMGLWAQLLLSRQLVNENLLTDAWRPADLPDGEPTRYGLGFNAGDIEGTQLIWHNGLAPGGQAAFGIVPDEELFVMVLANSFNGPNTTDLMREMVTIMLSGVEPAPAE